MSFFILIFVVLNIKNQMHKYLVFWRKYGALVLILIQGIIYFYNQNFIYNVICGLICLLWLTIPCGISVINKYWWLWIPRQIIFICFAIVFFYEIIK